MFSGCCWFHLIAFCFTYALAISVNRPYRCELGVEEGDCEEQFLRWFFNSKTGHCETFIYSGCGGNANNFNATMYCLLACNGTEADTHQYSIASNETDQLKTGNEKDQEDNKSKVIRSKRSDKHPKSISNVRKTNHKDLNNDSKDGNDIQEILSQLSRSVNLLQRIADGNLGKTPRKPPGKKHKPRRKSSTSTAPIDTLITSKQAIASDEEGKERSLKAIDTKPDVGQSKTNDQGDDETDFNVEERNMLDVKIKSIISDPSFVFSYRNISARDMSALKEVVFGMDTKALRLVSPSSQADDKGGEVDARDGPGEATLLRVPEAEEKKQVTEEQLPVNGT